MNKSRLKALLDAKAEQYNRRDFIQNDPILIPHGFSRKQDIEISAFFAAMLAWGQRVTIMANTTRIMEGMDGAPYDFILNHADRDLKRFRGFVHRTFNETDLLYFIHVLKLHYQKEESLESAFSRSLRRGDADCGNALIGFHHYFFSEEHPERTRKHVSTPERGSACKRLNMFLRWMVRNDSNGVDFGIWNTLKPSQLICPLDVHVQRAALELGLLQRTQADWKAALELTANLKRLDAEDPVRYDFALFGISLEKSRQM